MAVLSKATRLTFSDAVNEKILKEKNAELACQLQTLSVLIMNEIPLTKELAMDAMLTVVKNE